MPPVQHPGKMCGAIVAVVETAELAPRGGPLSKITDVNTQNHLKKKASTLLSAESYIIALLYETVPYTIYKGEYKMSCDTETGWSRM